MNGKSKKMNIRNILSLCLMLGLLASLASFSPFLSPATAAEDDTGGSRLLT